jgi:8-oxo-dGTP diphosphatase
MEWRSGRGRTLADYPRPSVAVDVALLTVEGDGLDRRLAVLVHRPSVGYAAGRWALPGTFVHEDELLADAALRALRDKVGVVGRSPQQLRVFDEVDRDDRGRVITVAHVDLVPPEALTTITGTRELVPVDGERLRLPGRYRKLAFDHDQIVAAAVAATREAYAARPDPAGLLGAEFTLLQLYQLHAAVLGPLTPQKDTFRRHMIHQLTDTGQLGRRTVGKPARLFRMA